MGQSTALWLSVIVALLVGGIVGGVLFSSQKEVVKEVPKEVKVENPVNTELSQKVEDLTKQLEAETSNEPNVLDEAILEYFAELNEDSVVACDGDDYSNSDVSQRRDIKEYSVTTDSSNRRDTKTTVNFEIDLKFSDGSDERPCYKTDEVEVTFHSNPNKDTTVDIS